MILAMASESPLVSSVCWKHHLMANLTANIFGTKRKVDNQGTALDAGDHHKGQK